jgi:hypothetical protein
MPRYGKRGSKRRRGLRPLGAILFGATVLSAILSLDSRAGGQNGGVPGKPAAQPAPPSPLEKPLALLNEGRRNFANVKDYSCLMQSRENVRGRLLDENVIEFKMRHQPYSVYMRWLAPAKDKGQEVCYVHGRNGNKMRVHLPKGGGAFLGWNSVDPNDSRVMEHSRHNIYEAGLGHLIEETVKHWEVEAKQGKTAVKMAEYTCNNRKAIRIETHLTERIQGAYCYRGVLYLDAETKTPLRTEYYDWPRPGGPADGELMEMYSYIDLRFNVGLTDQDFNK